ncbi:hypothetical protein [Marinomonas mediterranea]|uniref:hypothetical protein n=1 Tax=Marinomonas mediterranea TaxID=119864 RepID=UPI00234BE0ED|nr:hypothetical protein [Marinomonas mediterranea]WCN08272.1 hypothetical protein GV055_04745 [Marinomonas mediterranea]WCN12339.1 hypothetical protein GV054_04635 [Marinomonas mediterranea]
MNRRQALVTGLGVAASLGMTNIAFSSDLSEIGGSVEELTRLTSAQLSSLGLAARDVSTVRFDGAQVTLPMKAMVARRYNANLYIKYELESVIRVFDANGYPLNTISLPDSLQVKDFAIDSYGNVFVLSSGKHEITWLDSQGNIVSTIGHFGWQLPAELNGPKSITIDEYNQIHVLNSGTRSIKVFTTSGSFVNEYGQSRWLPERRLGSLDGYAKIYVTEGPSGDKTWLFSTDGEFIAST